MSDLTDTALTGLKNPAQRARVSQEEKCPTTLIADRPASREDPNDRDAFESENPHRRVAEAIANVVGYETGGIAIGLEGSWGSGKTTVVNLLREELSKAGQLAVSEPESVQKPTPSILVFLKRLWPWRSETNPASAEDSALPKSATRQFALITFDAWAHEKDPLRRTFLENLIPELQALGWVDRERWKKRLEIIGQRREEKHTESFPQLRPWGIVVGISFFLVPIGTSLLSASSKDVVFPFDLSLSVSWKFLNGLILVTSPVLILTGLYLFTAIKALINRYILGKSATNKRDPGIWSMLFQRIITSERTETFKTPNPTSVEFEFEFKALLDEALDGKIVAGNDETVLTKSPTEFEPLHRRHIILILDNLDRVDATDALSVWSTLQTFLSSSYHHPSAWADRLWNIVLYDPSGIRALWDNEAGHGASANANVRTNTPPSDSVENAGSTTSLPLNEQPAAESKSQNEISSSFIDKSFRVRFEVPPPVSSDWRAYLFKFLRNALPLHDITEFYEVHSVLAVHVALAEHLPTIRGLKLFVNQIGAIHRQWPINGHRRQSSAKSSERDPKTQGKSAPLCKFPLKDIAYFVLLRRRGVDIIEGLRRGTLPENEFKDILDEDARDNLVALFFNVEVDKARQILLQGPIEKALLTANGAELVELASIHGESFWDVLQTVVTPAWLKNDSARIASAVQGLAMSSILEKEKPPLALKTLRTLRNAAIRISSWPSFNKEKAQGLVALWRWNFDLNPGTQAVQSFTNSLLHAVALSLTTQEPLGPVTIPIQDWFDGLTILLEEINRGKTDKVDISRTIVKPLSDRLLLDLEGNPALVPPTELRANLEALFKLREVDSKASNEVLEKIGESPSILHHLHTANEVTSYGVAAWCLFIFFRRLPNSPEPKKAGNSILGYSFLTSQFEKPHPHLVKEFCDLLAANKELELLIRILDENSAAGAFIGSCFEISANQAYALELFTPELIISRWHFLNSWQALTNSTQTALVSRLSDEAIPPADRVRESLDETIIKQGFEANLTTLYSVVALSLKSESRSQYFRTWCVQALQEVSVDEWVKQLSSDDDLLGLLFAVSREGEVRKLNNYAKAVSIHANNLLRGGGGKALRESPLFPLGEADRVETRNDIRNMATAAEGRIGTDFFVVFGDEFADMHFLLEHGAEKAGQLFLPILRNHNVEGLSWILDLFRKIPTICEPFSKQEIGRIFIRELTDLAGANLTADGGLIVEEILKLLQRTS